MVRKFLCNLVYQSHKVHDCWEFVSRGIQASLLLFLLSFIIIFFLFENKGEELKCYWNCGNYREETSNRRNNGVSRERGVRRLNIGGGGLPLKSPRGTITQQRGAASHGHRRHFLMTILPDGRRRRWVRIWGAAVAPPERGLLGGAIPCPKREAAHGRWWPSIFTQLTEPAASLPAWFLRSHPPPSPTSCAHGTGTDREDQHGPLPRRKRTTMSRGTWRERLCKRVIEESISTRRCHLIF